VTVNLGKVRMVSREDPAAKLWKSPKMKHDENVNDQSNWVLEFVFRL
jgi:hypothetical protein